MASDLGEVRVQVEQEGAQDAAEQIGDAAGESDSGGGGQGGGIGGMLGGISTKLAGILGFVAILASLKPIQEILSGIQRLFSITLLPLIALLTTFLRPILQKLLRLVAGVNFDSIGETIDRNIRFLVDSLINKLTSGLSSNLPGVGDNLANSITRSTAEFGLRTLTNPGSLVSSVGQEAVEFGLDLNTEKSRSSLDQGVSESANRETTNNGVGGQ